MAINYKKCPRCGSLNTIKIIYGMPTHDAFLMAEEGKINKIKVIKRIMYGKSSFAYLRRKILELEKFRHTN